MPTIVKVSFKKGDKEEYKKKTAIDRFFSWIESCKKVFP
jgi:hypothetical protein